MRRRKLLQRGLAAGSASLAGCSGITTPEQTETISLSVGSFNSKDHITTSRFLFEPWIPKVNELLDNYQIEYEFYGNGAVGGAGELYDLAAEGTVDLAMDLPAYQQGRMPLNGVINLPIMWPNGDAESTAANQVYFEMATAGGDSEMLYEEFASLGVRPIMVATVPPYQLVTNKEPIHDIDQLQGLVLRSGGGTKSAIGRALGMSPVEIPGPDVYTAHQQGTVNADILAPTVVVETGFYEVMNYVTTNLNLGGFAIGWVMGTDTYSSFPEEVKEAMMEAGGDVVSDYINKYIAFRDSEIYSSDRVSTSLPIDEGSQIYIYETDAKDSIHNALKSVIEDWIQDRNEEGLAGKEAVNIFQELQQGYS